MNIQQLIAEIETEKHNAEEREKDARADIEHLIANAETQGRKTLNEDEDERCENLFGQIGQAKADAESAERKLVEARKVEVEERELEARMRPAVPGPNFRAAPLGGGHTAEFSIGSEPHTYAREKDPTGNDFLTDVGKAYFGNPEAQARLQRHMHEMRVDRQGKMQERTAGLAGTGDFPGLLVPQYLVDMALGVPSNGRVLADHMTHVDLPDQGMEIDLAVGSTATSPAIQTSENVAVTGSTYNMAVKTIPVRTAEAWQQVSRQAIERGRVVESVLISDLMSQMDALIDNTVLNTATVGLSAVAFRTEYDSASPTAVEMYPFLLKGLSKTASVAKNKLGEAFLLGHPRRLYWLESQMTTSWPLIAQPGVPPMASGYANGPVNYQNRVTLPNGTVVYGDYNVVTAALDGADTGGTEDVLYVVSKNQALLFEAPDRNVLIRAEAPAASQLGVLFVLYEYFGFYFQQLANVHGRIDGTGTIAPTGF